MHCHILLFIFPHTYSTLSKKKDLPLLLLYFGSTDPTGSFFVVLLPNPHHLTMVVTKTTIASKPTASKATASKATVVPASPTKRTFSSPVGRKSKKQIVENKILPGWYLRSILLDGGLELVFVTTSTFTTDAFINPLIVELDKGEAESPLRQIGLMGAYYMRISLHNPGKLINTNSQYQRKAFVRVLDQESDSSDASRLEALNVMKTFLEAKDHNKFNTPVFIQKAPAWDMTPSGDTPLPKLDHFIHYDDIVKILHGMFDSIDGNWAASNPDSAAPYFTAGHIPFEAHTQLGFLRQDVMDLLPSMN
jgi:hypothetical protein